MKTEAFTLPFFNSPEFCYLCDKMENRLIKHSGQVFTPPFLVREILDFASYCGDAILQKHAIDNSCGDGAFLCEMVARYCQQYLSAHGGNEGLKEELEQFMHGIEIDQEAYANCLYNLNSVVREYGLENVRWDIINGDALGVSKYDHSMDYVIGNPPYVRVHNLEDTYANVKRFSFAQDGMTDLYLVFYELGFKMLKTQGKLCYITPSSWLSSLAGEKLRKHVMRTKTLAAVIDLEHFQAFDNATTYTMIALFDNNHTDSAIDYYSYNASSNGKVFIDRISYFDFTIEGVFYLAPHDNLALLQEIRTWQGKPLCSVKNGFATLADRVFILDVCFDELTIPVLKASTGKWHKGFYPYDKLGRPLAHDEVFSRPKVADYLNANKADLLKGKDERDCPLWYLYGRTQALKDVYTDKYAINMVIRDIGSIKLTRVPSGSGLYSGLYILTEVAFEVIEEIIKSPDFIGYVKMLKKYKSGGYYTFNSKDLEQYLNFKLQGQSNQQDNDKPRIFESNFPILQGLH